MAKPEEALSPLISNERLRELSGGGWLFRFLEQFPKVRQLRPGVEEPFLRGALDIHVHADPCSLNPRNQDFTEVAVSAAQAGMRAIVRKDHRFSTVGEAYAVQRHIDHLVDRGELATRVEVFGGVPLGYSLDPGQVKEALRFPTFKMLWFNPVGGEPLVQNGKVRPEVETIIAMARDNEIGINLGQPSHSVKNKGLNDFDGLMPLVEAISLAGGRAVLDHPLSSFSIEQIAELCRGGMFAGLYCYPSLPSVIKAPLVDPTRTLELLNRVGAERCIIASDVGLLLEPTALEAYRQMVRLLLVMEVEGEAITAMIKTNPATLIGLNGTAVGDTAAGGTGAGAPPK
ncbi:MAG: hypothetical protein IIA14_13870 [SAR324 cluster bacterium]|nr:hypothetical protein [SAR324 cluster bacterium]